MSLQLEKEFKVYLYCWKVIQGQPYIWRKDSKPNIQWRKNSNSYLY